MIYCYLPCVSGSPSPCAGTKHTSVKELTDIGTMTFQVSVIVSQVQKASLVLETSRRGRDKSPTLQLGTV